MKVKLYLTLVLALSFVVAVFSQGNPAVASVGFYRSPIGQGDTTTLTVVISNATFDSGDIPVGQARLTISLPSNEVYTLSDGDLPPANGNTTAPNNIQISDDHGDAFDWVGDGVGTYQGINNIVIPQGEQIWFKLQIYGNTITAETTTTVNIQGLAGTSTTNIPGDDNRSAALGVDKVNPIILQTFTAFPLNNDVNLNWKTATELNNSHFKVQRSADGQNFENIGRVNGNGTTSQVISYEFTDKNPFPGKNYYRLKQVDYDGAFEYSHVEQVSFGADSELKVFPNPVSPGSEIHIQGNKIRTVQIFNMLGQLVLDKIFDQPQSFVTISSANLAQGIYTTRVNGVMEKRMVIK